jgi:hypothetical protein
MNVRPLRKRSFPASRLLSLSLAVLAAAGSVLLAGWAQAGAATGGCPSLNRPNMLKIVAGSPQTAQLEKPFQTNLQVTLANTNGCPLTGQLGGIWVDFSAPASGPSGTFATSGTNRVTVGTDASGVASAPTFTANDAAGSYSLQVDSDYGSVLFYLTNTASGVVASIAASGESEQSASVNARYGQPLGVLVLDADGRPVQGASVTFSLGTGATGASASFVGGGAQASESTKANGLATSPPFVANKTAGRFSATASVAGSATSLSYTLRNLAGRPAAISAGGASGQSVPVGSRFPIRLAVSLTDANENPVSGAIVTFTAPARGPSGHFASGGRSAHVKTNAKGVALAPAFTANRRPGGYIVTASAGGERAAFALVNRSRA